MAPSEVAGLCADAALAAKHGIVVWSVFLLACSVERRLPQLAVPLFKALLPTRN